MAVITTRDVDYGVIFGPVNINSTPFDPTYVIGLMTLDDQENEDTLSVDPFQMSSVTRDLEWLLCIPSAKNEEEQNVEAYCKGGNVFYRTLRIIRSGEPLYVWYSKDFCQLLNIRELKRNPSNDVTHHSCKFCGEVFKHEFQLRAHIRFKCEESTEFRADIDAFKFKDKVIKNNIQRCKMNLRKLLSKNDFLFKTNYMAKNESCKRIGDIFDNFENQKPGKVQKIQDDKGQSNEDSTSAFRKVEKLCQPSSDDINGFSNISTTPYSENKQDDQRFTKHVQKIPGPYYFSSSRDNMMCKSKSNSYQQSTRKMPLDRSNVRIDDVVHTVDVFGDRMKHFMLESFNPGIPFMKNTNPMVEKILQNTSPVAVTSPINAMILSQNWCAKCNASFRMTSDLVYHMRSHHKREFDPVKKKRDDKLKCNICQESFRERHHLTRHMTSHA